MVSSIKKKLRNLDIVYYSGEMGDIQPLKGVLVKPIEWEEKTREIINPLIIGAVISYNSENGYIPSPVFSEGKIDPVEHIIGNRKIKRWEKGLHPGPIVNGYLILRSGWAGQIDLAESGESSVYLGHGGDPEDLPAILFKESINFNPLKQLVYVRSPNGSQDFSSRQLEKRILLENNVKQEYALIYDELSNLQTGRFARNQMDELNFR